MKTQDVINSFQLHMIEYLRESEAIDKIPAHQRPAFMKMAECFDALVKHSAVTPSFAEQWRAQAVKRHEIRDAKGFAAKWFHAGEKFAKGQK